MGFWLFDIGTLLSIHNLKPICFNRISEKALEKQIPERNLPSADNVVK